MQLFPIELEVCGQLGAYLSQYLQRFIARRPALYFGQLFT